MQRTITEILIWAVPVVLAITVHEAAHGYVARHFGDPTAERAGRITLNPLRHIDPVGTVIVPLMIFILSSLAGNEWAFGWAKPVPVNFGLLRNPKADMLWVAAAGPFANLLMAIAWALAHSLTGGLPPAWKMMAFAGMTINCVLFLFNLLPIPPLDGGRIAVSLLPHRLAWKYARLEPFGLLIVVLLLASGVLDVVLGPLLNKFVMALVTVFG
jgi:Zn-dependent protease